MRHFLTIPDLQASEVRAVFQLARELKAQLRQGQREPLLARKVMALVFQKPSLRTRVSFEAGMAHLGGSSLFLGADTGFGKRETIEDFGAVLSEYVDIIVIRAFGHQDVERLAAASICPVINGLTDYVHPCQALADLFTVQERVGSLEGLTLAYVGDANNVARSLAQACAVFGLHFHIAAPRSYQFDEPFRQDLRNRYPDLRLLETEDPHVAVRNAHVVYTDVWASMGQEQEAMARAQAFRGFQVNGKLMASARPDALFMHCLPAHRGEEVAAEVIDGPPSVVIQQAANRMHLQKGIVLWLMQQAAKT